MWGKGGPPIREIRERLAGAEKTERKGWRGTKVPEKTFKIRNDDTRAAKTRKPKRAATRKRVHLRGLSDDTTRPREKRNPAAHEDPVLSYFRSVSLQAKYSYVI